MAEETSGVVIDVEKIMDDYDSRQTLVRLYSLLLEIDMRNNPELYQEKA